MSSFQNDSCYDVLFYCIKYFAKNIANYIFYDAVLLYTFLCFCLHFFKDTHRNP